MKMYVTVADFVPVFLGPSVANRPSFSSLNRNLLLGDLAIKVVNLGCRSAALKAAIFFLL